MAGAVDAVAPEVEEEEADAVVHVAVPLGDGVAFLLVVAARVEAEAAGGVPQASLVLSVYEVDKKISLSH